LNTEAKKAGVSFIASRKKLKSDTFEEAFSAVSSEITLNQEEKIAIDFWDAVDRQQQGMI